MAVFTQLNLRDLQKAMSSSSGNLLVLSDNTQLLPIAAGSINTGYKIVDGERTYFLRVYEQAELADVRFEEALIAHLYEQNVSVIPPIESFRFNGKPTVLFRFELQATPIDDSSVVSKYELGRALARFHLAGQDFGWKRQGRFTPEHLNKVRDSLPKELSYVADDLGPLSIHPALPQGLIHGDLFVDNVLFDVNTQKLVLLDWESASTGPWLLDLAVLIHAWTLGVDEDEFWKRGQAMVDGYQSVRLLHRIEWKSFQDVLLFAAARFTLTRITDFHLKPTPTIGEIKDFREFHLRHNWLQNISTLRFR